MQDLGNSLGGDFTYPYGVNDRGVVAGLATLAGNTAAHAVIWRKVGELTDLGVLDQDTCSFAFSINARTQVVGVSYPCSDFSQGRAFLWEDGSMFDLNPLIPAGSPLHLLWPLRINDRGEIAGSGFDAHGDVRDFLVIPCGDAAESCADAPLDSAVAQNRAVSGAALKTMTAEELAIFKQRMARMPGRNRGFGLWPRR